MSLPEKKNVEKRNNAGNSLIMFGIFLLIGGTIFSFERKVEFIPLSDNMSVIIPIIGSGISFILLGINMLLKPSKIDTTEDITGEKIGKEVGTIIETAYETIVEKGINTEKEDFYTRNIADNEIAIIEFLVAVGSMLLLWASYPGGWSYPHLYTLIAPYILCISLLTISIIYHIDNGENETIGLRMALNNLDTIVKEKERISEKGAIPEYLTNFSNDLTKNIDQIISVMYDFKSSVRDGTDTIAKTVLSIENKYRNDSEQLHSDVQKFKQRTDREGAETKERANRRMIEGLMDMLYRIDEMSKYKTSSATDGNITDGNIEKIKNNIYNILKKEDVEIINPLSGSDFDDKKYCAIQTIDTDKFSGKKIIETKKIGCMFKSGKIIKYAEVVVSKDKTIEPKIVPKVETKIEPKIAETKIEPKIAEKKIDNNKKVETKIEPKIDNNKKVETKIEPKIAEKKIDNNNKKVGRLIEVENNKVEKNKSWIDRILEMLKW